MFEETKYLQKLITNGTWVTVYLTNGFQMRGVIMDQGQNAIQFFGDNVEKLIYKNAISTIEPCK